MLNPPKDHIELPAHFARLALTNSYARLPSEFFSSVKPTPVSSPTLIALNQELVNELNLDGTALSSLDGIALLAGNAILQGSQPIAEVYAGHQFGQFNPQLGDGRAILLGEVVDLNGQRRDLQLKGAGPTPYSRSGDGRAALGPVIREYILSEAMYRLGIKTTRALAAVATGEVVYRNKPLPGAVITRIAASHVRIGTFEYFANRSNGQAVRQLADYVIDRHYPEVAQAPNPYLALLAQIITAQATLVADWLLVGFIHGVMNTDNMTISGETIDYGPCAFMERYDPTTVFSSIDHGGRYAYGNQGSIALWNLTRLAECLVPLLHVQQDAAVALAQEALSEFSHQFNARWLQGAGRKLGLSHAQASDQLLISDFLQLLGRHRVDFTLGFRVLSQTLTNTASAEWLDLFENSAHAQAWQQQWCSRLQSEPASIEAITDVMDAVNPLYIPRNHKVEEVISAAYSGDLSKMQELIETLKEPYREQAGKGAYTQPSSLDAAPYQTFCGT